MADAASALPQIFPDGSLLDYASLSDEIDREAPEPMPAFIMFARHRRKSRLLVRLSGRPDHRQAFVAFGKPGSDTF